MRGRTLRAVGKGVEAVVDVVTSALLAAVAGVAASTLSVMVATGRHAGCDRQYEGDVGTWVCPDTNAYLPGAAAVGLLAASVVFVALVFIQVRRRRR